MIERAEEGWRRRRRIAFDAAASRAAMLAGECGARMSDRGQAGLQGTELPRAPGVGNARHTPPGVVNTLQSPAFGDVAQLGERRVRNAKVGSSILLVSTIISASA